MKDDLPDGWADCTLSDVVHLEMGQSPDGNHTNADGDGLPLVGGASDFGEFHPSTHRYTTEATKVCEAGDIILCIRATIGNVNTADRRYCLGRGVAGMRPNLVAYDWVKWLLTANAKELDAAGTGSTFRQVDKNTLTNWPIRLPPIQAQHRIVTKINSLFARSSRARDELAHTPKLIERYRQAVLGAAFRGDLTADWRAANAALPPAQAFVANRQRKAQEVAQSQGIGRDIKAAMLLTDNDLNRDVSRQEIDASLPPTWAWAGIGQVFGVYVGATPSRQIAAYWGGKIPWVSSGEVAFARISDTTEKITDEGLANASTRLHPPGTVLLGMIGEGKTRGQAAILDIDACNNQNCAAIRVSEAGYPPEYLYWHFLFVYEQTRTVGSGNGPQALNKDRVQRLLVPLAPPAEAAEIVRVIEEMLKPLGLIQQEAERAAGLINRLDQSILDKAFTGKLAPQDPADEPASKLLERIKAARESAPKAKRGRRGKA